MLLEVYSGDKYCPTMEKLISDPGRDCETERERSLNMIRVILVIHSGLFWALTSTNTTLGCGGLVS